MKRKQNQITITAIIICLACAVSGLASEMPKYEKNAQTGEKTITLGSIEEKSYLIEAKSFRTNLTSGTAQQIADNVVVQYKMVTDKTTLKPIADDLAFLIGIKVKCMNTMSQNSLGAPITIYSAEMLIQYPELQGPQPKAFFDIILGRGTGRQVLEQLAEMFSVKVMWSNDTAFLVAQDVTAENLSMMKFVE